VRNITADYVANGWGDYLVLETNLEGIANGVFSNATIEGNEVKIDDTTYRYIVKCNANWRFNSGASLLKNIKTIKQWPSIKPTSIWLGLTRSSAITYVAPLITDANVSLLGPTSGVENNITIIGGTATF
jgi:hypothetical protein